MDSKSFLVIVLESQPFVIINLANGPLVNPEDIEARSKLALMRPLLSSLKWSTDSR